MADSATLRRMMVDTQVRPSDVTKFPIIAAMLDVPREAFVPRGREAVAYGETSIPLGDGREILEPRTLAKLLDAVGVERDETVLVVGANLGYATALLSRMATSVVAVEEDEAMAADAEAALAALGADNAVVMTGPLAAGLPKAAPFDVILVEGGVEEVPAALLDQLRDGGRIAAIFVDGRLGQARVGVRAEGRMGWRYAFDADAPVLPGFARERSFAL
ncbi:protein-L-isoaspartate O-methyltransferase [Jannaschia sp. W003]|uniref:protein-L-isoaspartate O-methyltransferase family protein n=1 Tax=Jannaschia sp. W003 TaxID=2867012 RepID=UPI0021A6E0E7|nr:protein-L-isoaspartate O-methyltransferase [Jannaschia sp. W003]UWQ20196.1 protein-L-isoaspartate O-methyltransferase [Jannaschia sp. W003]